MSTCLGEPHFSCASFASKYQSGFSSKILHRSLGCFGGAVAQPAKVMARDKIIAFFFIFLRSHRTFLKSVGLTQ